MEPYKFAIIGVGNIGKFHIQAVQHIPQARVSVICENNEEVGRAQAQACGAIWVKDFQEAVQRPDVDIVSICTPSGTHTEIGMAAARAGKHLLVEKPLDINLIQIDRLINAARQAGVVMTCVFPYRFNRGGHKAREAIQAGRLGKLALGDAYVKWYRAPEYYQGSWRGTQAMDGGGAIINQSIHSIDMLQWLAGPVRTVFAHKAARTHTIEVEDTASAVVTFENGAMGVIQGTTSCWPGEKARVELRGDSGTIILEEGRITTWKLKDSTAQEEQEMLTLEQTSGSGAQDPTKSISYENHRRQMVELIEDIEAGRQSKIDGLEARKSVEIIRALYASAERGKEITLPFDDSI